jgi:hypothetical protein
MCSLQSEESDSAEGIMLDLLLHTGNQGIAPVNKQFRQSREWKREHETNAGRADLGIAGDS